MSYEVRTVYRLIWTSDVGFSGMSEKEHDTLEGAQAEADTDLSWRVWERDSWKSTTPDKYGDTYTITRSYRY